MHALLRKEILKASVFVVNLVHDKLLHIIAIYSVKFITATADFKLLPQNTYIVVPKKDTQV